MGRRSHSLPESATLLAPGKFLTHHRGSTCPPHAIPQTPLHKTGVVEQASECVQNKLNYTRLPSTRGRLHGVYFRWDRLLSRISRVRLCATPWTVARQAPLSMGFSRQEYWSGLSCPPPGELPNPGIEPRSPALQTESVPAEPPGKPPQRRLRCFKLKGWESLEEGHLKTHRDSLTPPASGTQPAGRGSGRGRVPALEGPSLRADAERAGFS